MIKPDGTVYEFTWDQVTNNGYYLCSIKDKFGNEIKIEHDIYNRFTKITDDLGREITFTYNGSVITKITDYAGREWIYEYENDNLVAVTTPPTSDYPNGLTSTYSYDPNHNLESLVDPNGNEIFHSYYDAEDRVYRQYHDNAWFDFEYDSANTTVITTDREDYITEDRYNSTGQLASRTVYTENPNADPNHFTTTYTYTSLGRLARVVFPAGNCVDYTYNDSGLQTGVYQKTSPSEPNNGSDPDVIAIAYIYDTTWPDKVWKVTDPMGNVTIYDYNSVNANVEKITYPTVTTINGNKTPQTTFTYDPNGRIETSKAPDGIIIKYEYYTDPEDPNNFGHLKKVIEDCNTSGLNIATEFKYDVLGRVIEVKDPNGDVMEYRYSSLDQPMEIKDPYGGIIKFVYNNIKKLSQLQKDITGPNQITYFSYDMYGNILTIIDPLNHTTTYGYNLNRDVNSIMDAENNKTQYVRNERRKVVESIDPNGGHTYHRYNANGKLAEIEDAKDNITTYSYDGFDRLTTITYPDANTEVFGYDKKSNITSKTNRAGEIIYYEYNALRWMTVKTRPGEADILCKYDIAGRLKEVSQSGNTLAAYTYDRVGRVASVTDVGSRVVENQYDSRGLRTRLDYPDNDYVTYEYDTLGRLSKINYNGSMVASYQYDELSRRKVLTLGNDANAVYTYDLGNRLTQLKNKFNSTKTQTISYNSYDNVGNRKNMVVDSNESKYKYDKLYQLVFADYPAVWSIADVNYYYDKVANRTSTYNGSTTSYSSNSLNQYSSAGGTSYSYDDNGNLTNDGTYKYYYDCENRLIDVNEVDNDHISHYEYDFKGRRITKTTYSGGTVTTKYVYDGDNLIAEYSGGGTLLRKYVYGEIIDQPICVINISGQNETKYYYHFDGLGSVVALTNNSGTVVEQYRYDVFGVPNSTSTIGNRFMFTGREYETESGLYYYRARYYKPSVGRFLQPDSIGYEDGMNLYQYGRNNPIKNTDPYGLACGTWWNDWALPDAYGKANFTRACRHHDRCYEGKTEPDCRASRAKCDLGLLKNMYDECKRRYTGADLDACNYVAELYFVAVSTLGQGPFDSARASNPDCCSK